MILLHGLGDTHLPFARLGTQLNLPNTACIAITAPTPVPFEESSFHWCDDVIFDSSTNGLDPDGGFKKASALLQEDIIDKGLLGKCHYRPRDIVFFGLGQGGMLALNTARRFKHLLSSIHAAHVCQYHILRSSGALSALVDHYPPRRLHRLLQSATLPSLSAQDETDEGYHQVPQTS